jgi:hypothetical protein
MAKHSETNTNQDDLFDSEIYLSLKKLGYLFPTTDEEFLDIINEANIKQMTKPASLQDPYSFLKAKQGEVPKCDGRRVAEEYQGNLAQAAREGQQIPDHIMRRMIEDRSKHICTGNNQ